MVIFHSYVKLTRGDWTSKFLLLAQTSAWQRFLCCDCDTCRLGLSAITSTEPSKLVPSLDGLPWRLKPSETYFAATNTSKTRTFSHHDFWQSQPDVFFSAFCRSLRHLSGLVSTTWSHSLHHRGVDELEMELTVGCSWYIYLYTYVIYTYIYIYMIMYVYMIIS